MQYSRLLDVLPLKVLLFFCYSFFGLFTQQIMPWEGEVVTILVEKTKMNNSWVFQCEADLAL